MVKCAFCGKEDHYHKGVHLIKNDGSINYLCCSKCRRNSLNLKRDKRRVMWTEAYREELHKTQKADKFKADAQAARAEAKKQSQSEAVSAKKNPSKK
ncbi:MAG: hypothetical protein Q8Q31_03705 [Nanoarchaeota archaeon]|nr:hypothetical protein [Nanoarchaeota archaeon]